MIDPSVRAVLTSRYTARRFFLATFTVIVACFLGLIVILSCEPSGVFWQALSAILVSLIATVFVLALIYSVWFWVTPRSIVSTDIQPLRAAEIREVADFVSQQAGEYIFFGRSGSFFRKCVLPSLEKSAKETGRAINVFIGVPDPESKENLEEYRRQKAAADQNVEEDELAINVVATCIAAYLAQSKNPLITFQISLLEKVPIIRFDISDRGLLISRDSKKLPGIYCNSGNSYYELFRSMVLHDFHQGKRVEWDNPQANVDIEFILESQPAPFDRLLSEAIVPRVKEAVKKPKTPYA